MFKKFKSTWNSKKYLTRSERDNLYIKVVDQLLTFFIKMAFIIFFLNMCYHYLEREIFLEDQVNSFKEELEKKTKWGTAG